MISIADVRDIAAMKIAALAARGTKRDFVDLYFICNTGLSLENIFSLYDKKYGNFTDTSVHIMKSLVYFNDAEPDPMPNMLKVCDWKVVKRFFEEELKKIVLKKLKT